MSKTEFSKIAVRDLLTILTAIDMPPPWPPTLSIGLFAFSTSSFVLRVKQFCTAL